MCRLVVIKSCSIKIKTKTYCAIVKYSFCSAEKSDSTNVDKMSIDTAMLNVCVNQHEYYFEFKTTFQRRANYLICI